MVELKKPSRKADCFVLLICFMLVKKYHGKHRQVWSKVVFGKNDKNYLLFITQLLFILFSTVCDKYVGLGLFPYHLMFPYVVREQNYIWNLMEEILLI